MQADYTSAFSRFPEDVKAEQTGYELYLADSSVLTFDTATHICIVVNRDLLPVALYKVDGAQMYSAIVDWLIRRALPVSRQNYEGIIKSVGLSSNTDTLSLITTYHALSLVDNYWIRPVGSTIKYSDVNLYLNHFSDLLTVSLLGGKPLTITGTTPDINQRGCMAKCYSRESDGIYIYKYSKYSEKIYAEVFASRIAQACGFDTIAYTLAHKRKKLCSKCRIRTSKEVGWVTASEISLAGYNPKELALKLSPNRLYQMFLIDYLTGNIDRHNENWSFAMNNSGQILGLTPLYDYDNCFLADENTVSKVTLHKLKVDAQLAMSKLSGSDEILERVYLFVNSNKDTDNACYQRFIQYVYNQLANL